MARTDYIFSINRDSEWITPEPYNFADITFEYPQVEGQFFFRREMKGELIFIGDDYDYFKARYDLGAYCDVYYLYIQKYYGTWDTDWEGYFSLTDCKFDFETCQVKVTPTVIDRYSCLLKNWDTKINVLNQEKATITSDLMSKIEFAPIGILTSAEIPQPIGYIYPYSDGVEFQYIHRTTETVGVQDYTFMTYAREAILLPSGITPVGSNWQIVTSTNDYIVPPLSTYPYIPIFNYLYPLDGMVKWARRISDSMSYPAFDDVYHSDIKEDLEYFNYYGEYTTQGSWRINKHLNIKKTYYNYQHFTQSIDYNSCFDLNDSIIYLLEQTCSDFEGSNLVSDFLTNSTNPVTETTSNTDNLYLIQKSDAKRPGASNPATKGEITFKELMDNLYIMFQLWWYIDDSNDLVILHQSEIEQLAGLDITAYLEALHKKKITFNSDLLYRYEQWQFAEANGDDFIGMPIEYDENCTKKDDNKTKSYITSIITTDLAYIQTNQDKISDEGFVVIATDGSDVLTEDGAITGETQLNGHLAIANLLDKYWRHNRPLSTGYMNGALETFESTQKIRKLDEISIQYCENSFDPKDTITTELGTAIVNNATFKPFNNELKLNLSI